MPIVRFRKNRPPIIVASGTLLMHALLDNGVPVASSCRGDGVCAKCRIEIVHGLENLGLENSTEAFLRERHGLQKNERISCQTAVIGDITIDTPYW